MARWRWRFAPLAVGLLLLEAISGYLLRPRPQVQPDKLTILPFTTFPGFEIGPSFSPDGNQIVFAWFGYEKEYQFDLYIKQVGQERVVQLTHHPTTFLGAAWSPDGRFIAFMRYVDADHVWKLATDCCELVGGRQVVGILQREFSRQESGLVA